MKYASSRRYDKPANLFQDVFSIGGLRVSSNGGNFPACWNDFSGAEVQYYESYSGNSLVMGELNLPFVVNDRK